jgi:succinate-semialdehyde dehydrogenase
MSTSGFATINPSTGEQIEHFSYFTAAQTEETLARSDKAFQSFGRLSVHKRAQMLSNLGKALRKNKAQLAKVITTEMGKVTAEAEGEIEKCAHEADWYAEHGPKIMADEPAATGTVNAYVSYLPLGPILAIMPWNFPIWQLTRMALPTLLAGNVVLVKHSANTQRSSLEFERVMFEAGFPEGTFQNLIINRDEVVNVINDPRVQGASVTGSVRAGSAVASEAGKVIKKTVMELGGSDAFIASSSSERSPMNSKACSWRRQKPSRWVTHSIPLQRWGQWLVSTCVTGFTNRWKTVSPRVPKCSVVANLSKARAPSTPPQY